MSDSPRFLAISGLAAKEPAAFVVETGSARVLLDLGEGPDAGLLPDIDAIGRVDAVILSHGHGDHVGALRFLDRIGNPPVFATRFVHGYVAGAFARHELPLRGRTTVAGIAVETGRSGHAPGGVWLHLSAGGGLLYMGDNCSVSTVFAPDPPPPCPTVVIDASYGAGNASIEAARTELSAIAAAGPVLLPVPADGRAVEIALFCAHDLGLPVRADARIRDMAAAFADPDAGIAREDALSPLASLCAALAPMEDLPAPHGVMLATPAQCNSGLANRLAREWTDRDDVAIVFTGHVAAGSTAQALTAAGRARRMRWPVHPAWSENAALVNTTEAERVVPAFGGGGDIAAMAAAISPARLVTDCAFGL